MNFNLRLTAILLDGYISGIPRASIELAAQLLGLAISGESDDSIRFIKNVSESRDVSSFWVWLDLQKTRGVQRIYSVPWNEHTCKKIPATEVPSWKDWCLHAAYSMEGGIAVVLKDSYETYVRKGNEFIFHQITNIRPSLGLRPPHHVRDEYKTELKEFFHMAEQSGHLRWVNNIRRRLAKLRMTPHPLTDLTEALFLLKVPPDAIQILDACLAEPYIFERFWSHNQFDLETPQGPISMDTVYSRYGDLDDFESYAIDIAINAPKNKVSQK